MYSSGVVSEIENLEQFYCTISMSPSMDFRDIKGFRKKHKSDIFVQDWYRGTRLKSSSKKKLAPVGIELTTDHHWFRSLLLIQLC